MTNLAATKLQKTCQACGEPRGSKDPAKFCGYCHKAGAPDYREMYHTERGCAMKMMRGKQDAETLVVSLRAELAQAREALEKYSHFDLDAYQQCNKAFGDELVKNERLRAELAEARQIALSYKAEIGDHEA